MGTREEIIAQLRANPGLRASELARAVQVDRTTALYHLRKLARQRIVGESSQRWFVSGTVAPPAREQHVALVARSHVLAAVHARPGAPKGELAEELGCARGTLAWHLTRLENVGLVRVERRGRIARVWPADAR